MMKTVNLSPLLKLALWLDAAVTGAVALLQLAALDLLVAWLGLPRILLLESGLFLVAYALALAWLASRPRVPVGPVQAVIAANALWAVGCAMLVLAGVAATWLGMAYLAVQAVAVVVFAALQRGGLRGSVPAAGEAAWRVS